MPLVSVKFSAGERAVVIELPRCDQVGVFFSELKRIVQGQRTHSTSVHHQFNHERDDFQSMVNLFITNCQFCNMLLIYLFSVSFFILKTSSLF